MEYKAGDVYVNERGGAWREATNCVRCVLMFSTMLLVIFLAMFFPPCLNVTDEDPGLFKRLVVDT